MQGKTISHYRVLEKIGEGGMGEVYLAEDISLERKVALKFLPASLHADPVAHKRFLREAKAAAAIDHPYICNIHEVSQTDDGQDYIVMEYVEGQTLRERLERSRLPLREALRLGSKVAQAVERAHKGGVIHRDLKPSNIMITPDGHAKVMDFGLAKRVSRDKEDLTSQLTREGTTLGTLAYMSPEQLRGEIVDAKSDIFSFGIVLYEMLTGVHPFRRETQAATNNAIMSEEAAPLTAYLPDAPEFLQHTVKKLLAKDKEQRFQTLHDARTDLTELAEISGPQVMRRTGRKWGLGHGIAAGLLVAVVMVVWLWYGYLPVSETPAEPLQVVRLTSGEGISASPSFSPDGTQIVYHSFNRGTRALNLCIRSLDSANLFELTAGSTFSGWPAWSPNGQEIAFVRSESWYGKKKALWLISYPGRSERKILDLDLAEDAGNEASLLSWFPDGRSLAIAARLSEDSQVGIIRLDIKTDEITPLSMPREPGLQDMVPCVSPDEKRLAFVRGLPWGGNCDLWVRPIPQGEATRLNRDSYHYIGGLAWTPDSREIYYIANEMLWRIAADGGIPRPVPGGGAGGSLSISPQGDRLVYANHSEIVDIWRLPGPRSTASERVASELIVSDSIDMSADFSPDSRRIAFASTRRRWPHNIWVCDADGRSNLRQLTSTEVGAHNPRWSPDGEWIAFGSFGDTGREIFVVRSSGVGEPRRITAGTQASWSHDGRWIYFTPNRSGEAQIWKIPVEEGQATDEPIQITEKGGFRAQEAPSGDLLYYYKPDRSGIWKVPTGGGEEILVLGRDLDYRDWCVADESIYFYSSKLLQRFELESGEITTVSERERVMRNLTVSPNGEWLVWDEQGEIDMQLVLLENFR